MNLRFLTILFVLIPLGGVGALMDQDHRACMIDVCPNGMMGMGVQKESVQKEEMPACCRKKARKAPARMTCPMSSAAMSDSGKSDSGMSNSDMGVCKCIIKSPKRPAPIPTPMVPMGIGDLMRGVSESGEILGISLAIETTPTYPLPFERVVVPTPHNESQAILGIWRI